MGQDKQRPSGRPTDGKAAEILEVARRLFAERGYRSVSVRDIAGEAGVTHPLIHYYWGSKQDLLAAVVAHDRSSSTLPPHGLEPRELIVSQVREHVGKNREYMLTRGRALLDGLPAHEWPGGFPGIQAALAALKGPEGEHDDADKRARESLLPIVAMLNGWILLEDQLLDVLALPDRDEAREILVEAVERLLDGRPTTPR